MLRLLTSSLLLLLAAPACLCGDARVRPVLERCDAQPELCVDAGTPPAEPDAGLCGDEGSVTGRICAPDQQTWVNGARVFIDGTDCNGQAQHLEASSAADGTFSLANVPPGDWTVKAVLGAFTQETPVTVRARAATAIPDNQLCVAQKAVRIAVVTGSGDKIEDLLTTLRLQFTLFGGDSSTWTTQAEPFLSDLARLKQYDLVFVDCAAAKASGTLINLGPNTTLIEQNLRAYVQQGGSVYSSDWALLFTLAAAPSAFSYATLGGSVSATPFDAKVLRGYAPQTVNARVTDPGLAAFLGKATVNIAFPKQSGANSLHWGLMSGTTGDVLVSADGVVTCGDATCSTAGAMRSNVPLAVRVRAGAAGQRGGNVVYTSFHNVAQSGPDVAQVLKYLVLNL